MQGNDGRCNYFSVEENVIRLTWGSKEALDFRGLLALVPDSALDSPRRSVVPLLDFWRTPETRLEQLSKLLDLDLNSASDLAFEYTVPVRQGRGKSSCTDLMILGPEAAIAVEAKYTEPRYETVESWLRDPAEPNRSVVLDGWLKMINSAAGSTLEASQIHQIPYQLIHRTASVFSLSKKSRSVVYQVFTEPARGTYDAGIDDFAQVLGDIPDFRFALVKCPLTATASSVLDGLEGDWQRGERHMAKRVRAALEHGPLYGFGSPTL